MDIEAGRDGLDDAAFLKQQDRSGGGSQSSTGRNVKQTQAQPRDSGKASKSKSEDQGGDGDDGRVDQKKPLSPLLKIAITVVVAVVLLAASGYGAYWWLRGSYYQSTNDAYLQSDQVSIAPRISGYVDEVLVQDNQSVAAGQPLLRISARNYLARIDQDRAQIAEALANAIETQAEIRQQQAQIAQNEAQLAQSKAQARQYSASAQFNDSEARRYRPLAASGAEPTEKLASYVSQAQQSRAQVEAAQAQATADAARIEYARRQIDIYQAQQMAAEAKVQRANAQLAADQVDLDATTVVSSIAGRVGDRTVRAGQYLQTGTRVMTIVPVDALYLKANFKETQIGLMRVGQPARVIVDALSSTELHGTVESFSPGTGAQFSLIPTDNATGNFTKVTQRVSVRIHVDAGPEARKVLVPGLSAKVEVDTIGAKSDRDAGSRESESGDDQRAAAGKLENAQNRQNHDLGAGDE